ncbi:MAG: energy transducer TonB, partial [Haliea sp.]
QQGVVQLRARVLASGRVGEVRLLRSSGYSLLDVSAMQALQGASFNPARTRSGKAVDAWVQLPFRFVLE